MTHGPEHHIEHAEHATHAVHDPFDRRVTISIAIIAAVLACVTMLAHRAHNDTLRLQGEGLQAQTEAARKQVEASNTWARYQAVNVRKHFYQTVLEQADLGALPDRKSDAAQKAVVRWQEQVEKYEGKMSAAGKDKGQLGELEKEAKQLTREGEEREHAAEHKLTESHEAHARANRFDLGELGLQLGVVVCSLAILTKSRGFWLTGIGCAVIGLAIALTGYLGLFMGHHH